MQKHRAKFAKLARTWTETFIISVNRTLSGCIASRWQRIGSGSSAANFLGRPAKPSKMEAH
jgi:hypothetical protein